jgi:lipopolysaccharide transport system ATP-binding protein
LATRTVVLANGKVAAIEETNKAISIYSSMEKFESYFEQSANIELPTVTRVQIATSEGGTLQGYKKPFTVHFEITMPDSNMEHLALSFQILNHLGTPILYDYVFDINEEICRSKGVNHLSFTYDQLSLYKGDYTLKVHLAETKNKTKFQEFDCCAFSLDLINEKEPEWGWQKNVCQYFEKGSWNI